MLLRTSLGSMSGLKQFLFVLILLPPLHNACNNSAYLFLKDIENTYTVCSGMKMFRGGMPQTVTFSTDTGLPLPNPVYLRMHAALCRVAQFSGAADRAAFLAWQKMTTIGGEDDDEDDDEDERDEFEDSE